MFTGLVQCLGVVDSIVPVGPGVRITIVASEVAVASGIGDSVAINGCCLTVVEIAGDKLSFEAGEETLSCTTLGETKQGNRVNIETSLKMGDALGGHLVSGHIDGVAVVDERIDNADWSTFWFRVPGSPEKQLLTKQMASKGSVAVDGVSLTLVDVEANRFSVALIPHTLKVTTLGFRQVGHRVNIETDLLAKYVERQLTWRGEE